MTNDNSTQNRKLSDFGEQTGTTEPNTDDQVTNDSGNGTSPSRTGELDDTTSSPDETSLDPIKKSIEERDSPLPSSSDLNLETGSVIATQCFEEEVNATISPSTAETYATYVRGYIDFVPYENLLEADVGDIKAYCRQRARNGRRESTIGSDIAAIKMVYIWVKLETEFEIDMDFFDLDEICASEFQTLEPINREPLSREELEKLYDSFNRHRDKLMATVAGEVGPRNIDITKIKIDDIDFEKNTIKLNNTKAKRTYTQPISDGLAVDLMHYIHQQRDALSPENDHLFPSQNGGKLSSSWFTEIVKEAGERAGLQEVIGERAADQGVSAETGDTAEVHRVTPHALRHTFNHLMSEAGIPIEARSDALDQDSIEVNREYYTPDSDEYIDYIRENLHGNNEGI